MKKFAPVILSVMILTSCVSNKKIEPYNPYPNMEKMTLNGNFTYFFGSHNPSSGKLIIILEGSGTGSVLGLHQNNEWRFLGVGTQLLQAMRDDYSIIIPEKWNRTPELNYSDDLDDRRRYTKDNLVECYVSTIETFLDQNNFSGIFLFGVSEGAAILPIVYERMSQQNLVKGIVSVASGGLSLYESYLINIEKEGIPEFWKNAYSYSIELNENIEAYYESMEKSPMGLAYRQMASFMNYRPFDYYKNINIPILFIHGKNDLNVAVESTTYIQTNLPDKPFEYIIYDEMGHIPMNDSERTRFRNDVAYWIGKTN